MIKRIAEFIQMNPEEHRYFETICNHFNVAEDWLEAHATEICEALENLGARFATTDHYTEPKHFHIIWDRDVVEYIAEMMYDDPCQNDFDHICYQYGVTEEWLDDHAKEICAVLADWGLFDPAVCKWESGKKYFRIALHKPNLYAYTCNGAQVVGVVMAFTAEEAKQKIAEKSNLTEIDAFYEVEGDMFEGSV